MTTPDLLRGLGLGEPAVDPADLRERLAETGREAWARLEAAGSLHPDARPPVLAMPPSYVDVLVAAVTLERREGTSEAREREASLLDHYLRWMPALRVELMATREAPAATFFRAPLDWDRLPRLSGAVGRLFDLLAEHDVPARRVLGAPSAEAFRAARPTVVDLYAGTYFGGFMPPLYGYPHDLETYAAEMGGADDPHPVLDRRLAAPLIHELSHFQRERCALYPPILDECLSGWLGVHLLDSFAYPAPGEDDGVMAAPWFAQVGQALVRIVGLGPALRAHAGVVAWSDVLPGDLDAAATRLGWTQYERGRGAHFLNGNTEPWPWLKLLFLAAAGEPLDPAPSALAAVRLGDVPAGPPEPMDRVILRDALRAMCLRSFLVERSYRTETAAPPGPVTVDLRDCRVWRAPRLDGLEHAPPSYLFPPAEAARLRGIGVTGWTLDLEDPLAVGEVADAILTGRPRAEGPGWRLREGVP